MKNTEKDHTNLYSPENTERLREIERIIGSTVIFSQDNKILMGRKDPAKGGVYANEWHLPGGGADEGETPAQAAVRETNEEVVGISLDESDLTPLKDADTGASTKILKDGERVWCKMQFNRFEVHLDKPATEYSYLRPGDDFVELRWFSEDEQAAIKQAGGKKRVFKRSSI